MTLPLPGSSDLSRLSADLPLSREDSRRHSLTSAGSVPREGNADLVADLGESSIAHGALRSQYEALLDANKRLQRERERYHALFQRAPDPFLVTDRKGTIEEANAAAAEMLGIPGALLPKKSLLAYLDASARAEFAHRLAALTESGRLDKWGLAIATRDGRIVPMEATASRLGSDSVY